MRLLELLGMWMDVYGDGDDAEPTLNMYYRAVPTDPVAEPRVSDESDEFRWCGPNDLPDLLAFKHVGDGLAAWRARTA